MKAVKKAYLLIVMSLLMLTGISVPKTEVHAATSQGTVYITDTGSKYHSEGCRHLQKSKHAISVEDAKSSGYSACKNCGGIPSNGGSAVTASANQKVKSTDTNVASGTKVWLSATGSKYHSINKCGNMNPSKARQVTESEAISKGIEKCSNCW